MWRRRGVVRDGVAITYVEHVPNGDITSGPTRHCVHHLKVSRGLIVCAVDQRAAGPNTKERAEQIRRRNCVKVLGILFAPYRLPSSVTMLFSTPPLHLSAPLRVRLRTCDVEREAAISG